MTDDAIEGARYRDTVFGDEFVIESVEQTGSGSEDIELSLQYDGELESITITLDQFRTESGHELIDADPG